jgi:hypothetical protein
MVGQRFIPWVFVELLTYVNAFIKFQYPRSLTIWAIISFSSPWISNSWFRPIWFANENVYCVDDVLYSCTYSLSHIRGLTKYLDDN